ncbi:DUF4249 family protein [Fulvivirga lutimaris]|uniref:DUF4249 family protein n=1 Tax=Fulvivirga lutimaris TaxID=1819566 RepID=UPI0012BC9A51|nr:DUF4249 family protein [Fulvivirga lutimaris]MTI40656.1 DUF4249 domain-containing protein [Fulvivirga lutimaris]
MKRYIIAILAMAVLASCEETVQLDLKETEPVVIIDGLVSDQFKNQYVKVSRSVDFYAEGTSKAITNATVSVTDGTTTYNYIHNPTPDPENDGLYFSEVRFAGEVGKTYELTVQVDGATYTAEDSLYPVTAIDSLTFIINDDEFEEPEREGYYYEMLFYAHEPQETEDFYLFKFYRNDTLVLDSPTDIYFSNDDLLAEEINGIPTASFYKMGDTGTVEMYSISNAGFIYYNDLINLLQSDGGMFGSPPVNPRTNVKGGALGFFQASSVVSETIKVEE